MKYVSDVISSSDQKQLLTNQQLTHITPPFFDTNFDSVTSLYLSHNAIQSLKGIEHFKYLEQLSLSFNQIMDIEELFYVKPKEGIKHLSIRGNFLDRHPDYKKILIEYFPNLVYLDGAEVTSEMRVYIKDILSTEYKIIPMINYLKEADKELKSILQSLSINMNSIGLEAANIRLKKYQKIPEIDISTEITMNTLKYLAGFINLPCENESVIEICKSLYGVILTKLKIHGNRNMERYLCYQCLKNNNELYEQYKEKINDSERITKSKCMEYAVELLLKETTGNKLFDEKYEYFNKFCQDDKNFNSRYGNLLKFPLFPLNDEYFRAFSKVIADIIIPIKNMYNEIEKLLKNNQIICEHYEDNRINKKLTSIGEMLLKKIFNPKVKLEFIYRLKDQCNKNFRRLNPMSQSINYLLETSINNGNDYDKINKSYVSCKRSSKKLNVQKISPNLYYQNHKNRKRTSSKYSRGMKDTRKSNKSVLVDQSNSRIERYNRKELVKDIDNLIKSVSKMKKNCNKKLKENSLIIKKTKKNNNEDNICSMKCRASIPKYLQQKRLAPNITMNPSYRVKTLKLRHAQ